MQQGNGERHWARTSSLMWIMTALWIIFSFVIHMFVNQLNAITILGFPLGFYMAAQGSLIAFVVMLFVFAHRQDQIDREEGVAEDD
jgi:putative solute:sodium symporter small subunit